MSVIDWTEQLARFKEAHLTTGIGVKDWCEQEGLPFGTAKRHISIKRAIGKSPKPKPPPVKAPGGPIGNQHAVVHGAYSRFFSAEALEIARSASLKDELLAVRSALATAHISLEQIEKDLLDCDDENKQLRSELYASRVSTLNAIDRLTGRVSMLEKDLVQIPLMVANHVKTEADTGRIKAATNKLLAETERLSRDAKIVTTPITAIVSDIQNAEFDGMLAISE